MRCMKPLTLFKCLCDDTRLKLTLLLSHGEMCVCDLMTALELSQPKISRHLALLREQQLVVSEKRGQWVYYRLSAQLPVWALDIIDQALSASQQELSELKPSSEGQCCP